MEFFIKIILIIIFVIILILFLMFYSLNFLYLGSSFGYNKVNKDLSDIFFVKKDKIYCVFGGNFREANILEKADSKTFKVLNKNYGKDKDNVFYQYFPIDNVDFETFKVINDNYAKDKNSVFKKYKLIKEFDSKTFEILNENYIRSNNEIYFVFDGITKLKDVDSQTFEVLSTYHGKDKNKVFFNEELLTNYSDSIKLIYLDDTDGFYLLNIDNKLFINNKIHQVEDLDSFESIGNLYFKDSKKFYHLEDFNDPRLEVLDSEPDLSKFSN